MVISATSAVAQSASPPGGQRSPFARLAELLAPYQPGKPLIALSLGEPQHPIPPFVGSILSQHINEFGRYPIAKGILPFR
ncbi:MAG TPA: aspartate aminotransferase, partial [Hyphomicrobium sp.]|nr:aspartate aminotransferase [Hyphomicrobium sp.]